MVQRVTHRPSLELLYQQGAFEGTTSPQERVQQRKSSADLEAGVCGAASDLCDYVSGRCGRTCWCLRLTNGEDEEDLHGFGQQVVLKKTHHQKLENGVSQQVGCGPKVGQSCFW